MHADRSNRTLLIVLAVLLIAAGASGIAASYGLFGARVKHERLLDNAFARYMGRNSEWIWPVVALVALVLVLLALRWLWTILFSTDRAAVIRIKSPGPGHTELSSGALSDAVCSEINGYHGVVSARARVIGDPQDPHLVVVVTVREDADLPELVTRIETEALGDARKAVGNPSLPIALDVVVSPTRSSRVA